MIPVRERHNDDRPQTDLTSEANAYERIGPPSAWPRMGPRRCSNHDPQTLRLQLWVGDRLQQEGHTSDMIFSVAHIIAHVSQFLTLEPGDLLLTGTPWGVGCFRTPPTFLAGKEIVRCAIEGIGTLANPTRLCEEEPVWLH